MHYKITAPVGHTGLVAGVYFTDGHATCCHPPMGAVEFLRRHGYSVVAVEGKHCHHHHDHCHHEHGPGEVVDEERPKPARPRRVKSADANTAAGAASSPEG
jgi:hypothetical protein